MCEAIIELFQEEYDAGIKAALQRGKVEAVLELLDDLGDVTMELRNKISAQTDLQKLKEWHKLAAKAGSLEDFIEGI